MASSIKHVIARLIHIIIVIIALVKQIIVVIIIIIIICYLKKWSIQIIITIVHLIIIITTSSIIDAIIRNLCILIIAKLRNNWIALSKKLLVNAIFFSCRFNSLCLIITKISTASNKIIIF